ncbi:MAG: TfoX family protein [Betaproteobacteria bacterium]|nr:MAG: TfoX family protein [Betaproteobacteria bacterium]
MSTKQKAHDPGLLAERLRRVFAKRRGMTERAMFGGVCFLHRGNMLCGTAKQGFMFRVGKDQDADALARPGARPMDFTGRRMAGFVWVDPTSCDARALKRWVESAERYVGSLAAK